MNRSHILSIFLVVCLACSSAASVRVYAATPIDKTPAPPQTQFVPITVNGRAITGPNSTAQRRSGSILVPVLSIAHALGDVVGIDTAKRLISVRRQTGTIAEFDARLGSVRENGAISLTVAGSGEIVLSPNADEQMLPIEIAAALFDISIRYDDASNSVLITRGPTATAETQSTGGRSFFGLYQLDYEYNLNRYGSGSSHDLNLNAVGRLGDGRFSFSSNSSGIALGGISLRNAAFKLERPNGQRFTAGDIGTGADLEFLSAMVRGGGVSVPVGDTVINAFAGRSYSGTIMPESNPLFESQTLVRDRFRYDTTVYGFSTTTKSGGQGHNSNPFVFSAGAMRFSGADRSGDIASGSVNYGASRLRLEGDAAIGKFGGSRTDNLHFNGTGAAIDLTGNYQATDRLSLQARYTHIGKDFLSPQAGLREPVDLKAAGVTWSPVKWFSSSVNASTASRPGDPMQSNKFVTASMSITPGASMPRFFISHTQTSTVLAHAAFTMLTAAKEFSRWRLYGSATRTKTIGGASENGQVGANFLVNDQNSIEVSQGAGTGGMLNGQADWRTSGLFNKHMSFAAGAGYSRSSKSGVSPYERLSASLTLPRQTSLQINYFQTSAGPTVLVSVKGSLFHRREATAYVNAPAESMNSFANATGRVYQDINLNGRYDEGIDQPQAEVKVRVDGNRYVETDAQGLYTFDSVAAGDHKVYIDLLSVRADLTLLDDASKNATLAAGHDAVMDFRLVRTGRISGRVWMDANENGKFDEGESPLPDVRIVTGSGRDTLTDSDGYYVIGDLAPGEHVVLIDEKTIPEKTSAGSKPLTIQVFPGRETPDVLLAVILTPADVKHFGGKP